MHERKQKMAARAGGFVGLPGGYGTFEEVLEAITWNQLDIHNKRTSVFATHVFERILNWLLLCIPDSGRSFKCTVLLYALKGANQRWHEGRIHPTI